MHYTLSLPFLYMVGVCFDTEWFIAKPLSCSVISPIPYIKHTNNNVPSMTVSTLSHTQECVRPQRAPGAQGQQALVEDPAGVLRLRRRGGGGLENNWIVS